MGVAGDVGGLDFDVAVAVAVAVAVDFDAAAAAADADVDVDVAVDVDVDVDVDGLDVAVLLMRGISARTVSLSLAAMCDTRAASSAGRELEAAA